MSEWSATHVPAFEVESESEGDQVVLRLRGELDLETAPVLRQSLHEAIEGGTAGVVVDLSRLEFLESTGISVLVDAFKLAGRRNVAIAVRDPVPAVRRVLAITGLLEVFGLDP